MAFHALDWVIFVGLFVLLTSMSFFFRRFAKGVAEFLVAGRHVGRYLGLESDSMAGLGAITILAMWQMNYKSGFVGQFWYLLTPLAATVVALTGFAIYRFRQTRAMTLGQFVEMRYGRSTRILFGSIAFTAGVLNMGVFPAAGAHFFVHYCGIPDTLIATQPVTLFGMVTIPALEMEISLAAALIMVILVGAAVIICFNGGQVTLVVTNFVQALFVNLMLIAIMVAIYRMFNWQQFAEAYAGAENADQLVHPFSPKGAADFDKTFYLIGIFSMVYWVISWAPNTLVTSSARDAHEAKMMRVMVEVKKLVYVGLGIGILPLSVFVLMHHPDFADQAAQVRRAVDYIPNAQIRSQMLTPAALQFILPKGLLGGFAGFILFAFLSTHTSYLLAWGGGLIQDVIIPLRGRPLEPRRHMKYIRRSVLGVAVFIVLFSILFKQNENLYMFLDLTGGLYLSSAVVLLGGLYWARGTTIGAWAAMLTGASVSLVGFVVRSKYDNWLVGHGHSITVWVFTGFCLSAALVGLLRLRRKAWKSGLAVLLGGLAGTLLCYGFRDKLPQNLSGRLIMFQASLISVAVYFLVSETTAAGAVDFNAIFNRSEAEIRFRKTGKWWQFAPEVPRGDRILISCLYGGIVLFLVCFIAAWIYNTTHEVSIQSWLQFWHVYVFAMFWLGVVFLAWVVTGGFRDLIRMFRNLNSQETNAADDGRVKEHHVTPESGLHHVSQETDTPVK